MVKIVFVWQLFYMGGGAVLGTFARTMQLSFRTLAPASFIWLTFSFGVCVPLVYFWHDHDLRKKVLKKLRDSIP